MREVRRAAIVLASTALAIGSQAGAAGAAAVATPTSPCAGTGMTDVPMLGGVVFLGLPFTVDPATQQLTLRDAVVCTDVPGPSGAVVDESVVVPAVDDQGAGVSQGVICTPGDPAATVSAQCAALAQPLVTIAPPTDGADQVGLAVSLPLVLCVAGNCTSASPAVATAVVTGMLQCTAPPASRSTVPNQGVICTWQGAELTADGVPLAMRGVSPTTAGAWVTPHTAYDLGFATVPADQCNPQVDPSTCTPQMEDPYAWARAGGGRVLLLVVPGHRVPVVLPVAVEACVQLSGGTDC
jgi:hypothetical protein